MGKYQINGPTAAVLIVAIVVAGALVYTGHHLPAAVWAILTTALGAVMPSLLKAAVKKIDSSVDVPLDPPKPNPNLPPPNPPPPPPAAAPMPLQLVQAGQGAKRPLVIGYFLGAEVWASLKAALGPLPCIFSDCDDSHGRFAHGPGGGGGVDSIDAASSAARAHDASFEGPSAVVLIGWSAGCQAVREQLRVAVDRIDAAVALDGISGSVPPVTPQLAPWEAILKVAVADSSGRPEKLFVVTHTQQTYTEELPIAQRFASTVTTAKMLCDEVGVAAPAAGQEAGLGNFHVVSSPSKPIDGDAHIHQVRVVMPDVVGRFVAPFLAHLAHLAQVELAAESAASSSVDAGAPTDPAPLIESAPDSDPPPPEAA